MGPTDQPIANPVVVLRTEFDDWGVLFNPDTADALVVNTVGAAIWECLDGSHNLDAIVAECRERFSEVPGAAPEEISAFIEQLVDKGFVGYQVGG